MLISESVSGTMKILHDFNTVGTVVILYLVLLGCVAGTGNQTCSCASQANGGCVPNQLCDPDNNCNKENVAYGKPATISSLHNSGDHKAGFGCVAVNGRTGHVYKFVDEDGTNCVHSAGFDIRASWQVDLGRSYTITDIIIYNRQDFSSRLADIWIYVDKSICKKLPSDTSSYGLISTITCDTPLRGQIVKMSKTGTHTVATAGINFCEVQIWVCKPGLFGRNCDETCRCDTTDGCDNYFGTCTQVSDSKSDSTSDSTSSLVGPITGAIVGGFVILSVSILIIVLCRRRNSATEEVQSSAPSNRDTGSLEMTTSKPRTADVTQGDPPNYESLQYQSGSTSRLNEAKFATEDEVYEKPV